MSGVDEQPCEEVLRALLSVVFLNFLGVSVVYPLLYEYAVRLDATPQMFGLLNSAFHLAQVAGSPCMHWIVGRYGRGVGFQVGFVGSAASYVGIAYAPHFPAMLAARLPIGVLQKTLTIASAYATDLVPPARRATALGRVRAMLYLSFLFGPPLGSRLAHTYGLQAPAILSACLFAAASACTWLFVPDSAGRAAPRHGAQGSPVVQEGATATTPTSRRAPGGFAAAARQVWNCPPVRLVLGAMLLLEAAVLLSRHTLPIALKVAVGLDKSELGAYWSAAYGTTAVAGMVLVQPLADRFGDARTAFYGAFLAAACLAVWAAGPATATFPCYAVYLAQNLICETCLKSLLTSHPDAPPPDAVLGLLDASKAAVGVSIPLVSGWLAAHSPSYPFVIACSLCAGATVPMSALVRSAKAKQA